MMSHNLSYIKVSCVILFTIISTIVYAQNPSFESNINILNSSFVNVLENHSNDGYLIFQNVSNLSGQNCPVCIPIHKVNLNGEIVSTQKLTTNTNAFYLSKVIKTFAGNFIATGHQSIYGGYLIKLDTSLNVLLSNWYQLDQENIQSRNIISTADGGFVMMGITSQQNSFLAKFDSSGVGLWAKTYSNLGTGNTITKVIEDPFGNFYLLRGYSGGAQHLLKLNNLGSIVWSEKFQDPLTLMDQLLFDLIYDDLNHEILISSIYGLIKVDTTGNKIWDKQYLTVKDEIGYLFIESDGNIISICNSPMYFGVILNEFDPVGNPIASIKYSWTDPFDGVNTLEAKDIIRTSDSAFVAVGSHKIYYPMGIATVPYFFKTTGTYHLGCHSFPWSEQITGSNQYLVDTVTYLVQSKNIISYPLPAFIGSLSIPDSVICSTTSIPTVISETNLVVFPNPNSGEFYIKLPDHILNSGSFKLEIYNNYGELVYNNVVYSREFENTIKINLNIFGLYLIKLSNSEYSNVSKVLMKP